LDFARLRRAAHAPRRQRRSALAGAVYGGKLTAIRLPDETVFQV